jgi:hypothetical protein
MGGHAKGRGTASLMFLHSHWSTLALEIIVDDDAVLVTIPNLFQLLARKYGVLRAGVKMLVEFEVALRKRMSPAQSSTT